MKELNLTERFEIEAAIYDGKAKELLENINEKDLILDTKAFPFPNRDHVDFITYALNCLGNVEGKNLLDCGCGTGASSLYFAMKNARVVGVDISEENIRICRMRARINNAEGQTEFRASPVELLDYEDKYFDMIFGNQILHHLDRQQACKNLRRMLKPGGKAIFCEPTLLLGSRLRQIRNSRLVRTILPQHADTPTESSISMEDIHIVRGFFEKVKYQGFHVFARLTNWFPISDSLYSKILAFDEFVLQKLAFTRRLSHFIVLELE